jgi:hypothetical protein
VTTALHAGTVTVTVGEITSRVTVKGTVVGFPARFAQHPRSVAEGDGGGDVGVAVEGVVFVKGVGVALGGAGRPVVGVARASADHGGKSCRVQFGQCIAGLGGPDIVSTEQTAKSKARYTRRLCRQCSPPLLLYLP